MHEARADDLPGIVVDGNNSLARVDSLVNVEDVCRRQFVARKYRRAANGNIVAVRRVINEPRHFVAVIRPHVSQRKAAGIAHDVGSRIGAALVPVYFSRGLDFVASPAVLRYGNGALLSYDE